MIYVTSLSIREQIFPLVTSHIAIAHLCNQFNHVFVLLIFMPYFKSINFCQNWLKIKLFLKKNATFLRARSSAPKPPKRLPPLQISGYASESNHVFALLIFMPPEFSLMPRLKSFNIKISLKLGYFCKKNFF